MRRSKIAMVLGPLLLLVVFSQACVGSSPTKFFANNVMAENGGGDGYPTEGKPQPGTYYRNIPGYACAGVNRIYSSLTVTTDKASLKTVNPADCSDTIQDVPFSQLQTSALSHSLVGAAGGLYELLQDPPAPGAPVNPVESWCQLRGRSDLMLDTVVTVDTASGGSQVTSVGSIAVNGNWQAAPSTSQAVSRILAQPLLTYAASSPVFNLVLSLAKDALAQAHLQMTYQNVPVDDNVSCLTGARLDPAPAPQNTIFTASPFNVTVAKDAATFPINVHMNAVPLGPNFYPYAPCMDLVDASGAVVTTVYNCFDLDQTSNIASGDKNMNRTATLQSGLPAGVYRIVVGYNKWTGTQWISLPMTKGAGVTEVGTSPLRPYVIGTLTLQ